MIKKNLLFTTFRELYFLKRLRVMCKKMYKIFPVFLLLFSLSVYMINI